MATDKTTKGYTKNIGLININKLFDIEPKQNPDKFCRTCEYRERHSCGSMIIQYCAVLKSNRTANGQLKIKCKTPACLSYKEETK